MFISREICGPPVSKEAVEETPGNISAWPASSRSKDVKVEIRIDDDSLQLLLIDVRPAACLTTSVSAQWGYCHVRVPTLSDILKLDLELGGLKLIILCLKDGSADEELGKASIAHLAETAPDVPFLVLSDGLRPDGRPIGKRRGALGHMAVGLPISTLVEAIKQAFCPDVVSQPEESGASAKGKPSFSFTSREMEVLRLLRRGKSNKFIAHELNLCESTVKVHVHSIMKKTQAVNRTEVVCLLSRSEEFDGLT